MKRFLSPQVAEIIESARADDALHPKRAEVVVVFCDLRGFAAFSATTDAEAVFRVISAYYEVLGGVIRAFDATLTHFSGDGVMVVLNAPVPCNDAPPQVAARFACAAQTALRPLINEWRAADFKLGFGIGFAAGLATVGQIGYADRHDYTAIGTVANLASRLSDHADAGQILVDQETAALGVRNLKGFSSAYPVFALSLSQDGTPATLLTADARSQKLTNNTGSGHSELGRLMPALGRK